MKEPLRITAVKGCEISTYRLSSGRCMVVCMTPRGDDSGVHARH
jgi:hypothetical protein